MPPQNPLRTILTTFIAFAVLGGFVALYWPIIVGKWGDLQKLQLYVGTMLAGVVGGVTAMFFEQNYQQIAQGSGTKPPDANPDPDKPAGTAPGPAKMAMDAAVKSVAPGAQVTQGGWINILKAAYVIGYLVTGIAALVFILLHQDDVVQPDALRNLGMTTLGLIVAVAKSVT